MDHSASYNTLHIHSNPENPAAFIGPALTKQVVKPLNKLLHQLVFFVRQKQSLKFLNLAFFNIFFFKVNKYFILLIDIFKILFGVDEALNKKTKKILFYQYFFLIQISQRFFCDCPIVLFFIISQTITFLSS